MKALLRLYFKSIRGLWFVNRIIPRKLIFYFRITSCSFFSFTMGGATGHWGRTHMRQTHNAVPGCIAQDCSPYSRVHVQARVARTYAPQTTQEQIREASVCGLCKMSATNWNRKILVPGNFYLAAPLELCFIVLIRLIRGRLNQSISLEMFTEKRATPGKCNIYLDISLSISVFSLKISYIRLLFAWQIVGNIEFCYLSSRLDNVPILFPAALLFPVTVIFLFDCNVH